jgi:hypothetical protein
MLPVTEDKVKGLELDFTLNQTQTALLCSYVKTEAFDIFQKLMEQEIRMINIRLLNTPAESHAEIIANHALAKGAGMFYAGFMQRLRDILQIDQANMNGVGMSPENPEVPLYIDEVS